MLQLSLGNARDFKTQGPLQSACMGAYLQVLLCGGFVACISGNPGLAYACRNDRGSGHPVPGLRYSHMHSVHHILDPLALQVTNIMLQDICEPVNSNDLAYVALQDSFNNAMHFKLPGWLWNVPSHTVQNMIRVTRNDQCCTCRRSKKQQQQRRMLTCSFVSTLLLSKRSHATCLTFMTPSSFRVLMVSS